MNWALVIMAERFARLACSLAIWISLLFCSASSMARFRVREIADVLVGINGASWACEVKGTKTSSATRTTAREEPGFQLVKLLVVMLASSLCYGLESGGYPPHSKIIRNAASHWAAAARHWWPAGSRKITG